MRLLATKKLDFHFKERLLLHNFSLIEIPFIQIEPIPYRAAPLEKNILISSKNAARFFLKHHPLPTLEPQTQFFCVGQKTAAYLKYHQAQIAAVADTAQALSQKILSDFDNTQYSFICGKKRLNVLESVLSKAGIGVTIHECYDTLLIRKKVSNPLDGILFYSPSAVTAFAQENTFGKTHCFCIGPTTGEAVADHTQQFSIAQKPDNNYLLLDIINHYATP